MRVKKISKVLALFKKTGWKVKEVIDFKDDRKSVNYYLKNDCYTVVMFTENNIVKQIEDISDICNCEEE